MKIEKVFPTYIGKGSLPSASALNAKLLRDILNLSKQDKAGKSWSKEHYKGGYTSYASLSDLQYRTPAFAALSDQMQKYAEGFAKEQGWFLKGLKLEMTACWMNIMPKNTYHALHLHPHSVISGTYYVSIPPGSVSLRLEDPKINCYMNAPLKKSSYVLDVKPKPGMFILFDSWLKHEVPPNQSQAPRISISFNYSLV